MVKDENVCLHCGLCAERCPYLCMGYAEVFIIQLKQEVDVTRSKINDCVIRLANVNGTGSASANNMFAKAIFRMGSAPSPKNLPHPIFKAYHLVRNQGLEKDI